MTSPGLVILRPKNGHSIDTQMPRYIAAKLLKVPRQPRNSTRPLRGMRPFTSQSGPSSRPILENQNRGDDRAIASRLLIARIGLGLRWLGSGGASSACWRRSVSLSSVRVEL